MARNGFTILARNFNVPGLGELDIVAEKAEVVHFVEVRARRTGSRYGSGAESITPAKIGRLRRTAYIYLDRTHLVNKDVRILAADVGLDSSGNIGEIRWIPMD